jgi:hypothetical protein
MLYSSIHFFIRSSSLVHFPTCACVYLFILNLILKSKYVLPPPCPGKKLIKVVRTWIIAVHDRNELPGNELFVVILFVLLLMARQQSI